MVFILYPFILEFFNNSNTNHAFMIVKFIIKQKVNKTQNNQNNALNPKTETLPFVILDNFCYNKTLTEIVRFILVRLLELKL
ncbi:hypothetical protein ATCC49503_11390 [Helicobacter pylori]|nr:hypothetical protein ATCC49503_11390 [Helicobacter pylori]